MSAQQEHTAQQVQRTLLDALLENTMICLVSLFVLTVLLAITALLTSQHILIHHAPKEHIVHLALSPRTNMNVLLVHTTIEQWVTILMTVYHVPVSICVFFVSTCIILKL